MRSLNNTGVTVPGGFRYFCEETKTWIPNRGGMPSYVDFMYEVKKHYVANNLPIGLLWAEKIHDQICATLDGQWCNEGGFPVAPKGGWIFDFQSVVQGTLTLGRWLLKDKGAKVEHAEAERRASICSTCVMNQDPDGCTNCAMTALREVANNVVHGEPTAYDNKLKSCKVCVCNLRAKIHLPLDTLRRYTTEEQMNALPQHCWLL